MTAYDVDLVAAMRDALLSGQFVLHYQPEVDLASGEVVAMEALLRWQHPDRGLLWPAEFLPAAEASGFIVELGEWVVDECLREVLLWQRLPSARRAGGKQLWVNVSAAQLGAPGFADRVATLVRAAGLPAGVLGFEVRETALGDDLAAMAGVLAALKDAGVMVALDDFGTWYSALSHLDELPLDAVKLDQRFVRGVGADLEDDAIVASVIRLAHAHGLQVVAEGVESWSEGARLCELECDRAHGYLFAGPQLPERARWLLSRGVGWKAPEAPAAVGIPEARTAAADDLRPLGQ
ncbi:MAG TPA: EAL domain-containing protein [Mycobacteriales bacterium]|jgi:EAL domain-containing protein (putative c-di-GMP-specific phosphodiesterase class I)|nr:EAL domain-containing protein [Mycobacteriales bacterium]